MRRFGWLGLLLWAAGCSSGAPTSELPTCAEGEVVQRAGEGWGCVALAAPTEVNALAQAKLACTEGQVPTFADGRWVCAAVTSSSGGDVTAVRAGAGLTGGADTGEATLAVDFDGSGTATTVARSDHGHSFRNLSDVPPGFLDLVDNDALGSLNCGTDQLARFNTSRAAWECFTLPAQQTLVETDPTVNLLAKSAALDGCMAGQVPVRGLMGWTCAQPEDRDTLAALSCADGQQAAWNQTAGAWRCVAPATSGSSSAVESVVAGAGLTTSRDGGSVQLAVNFVGTCVSGRVACDDDLVAPPTPSLADVLASGGPNAGGQRISNLGAPTTSGDAVTKGYVDALSGGGGASATSLLLCCGATCAGRLPGWDCDQVAQDGALVMPMPDRRGMISIPRTGSPRVLAAIPPTTLEDGGVVSGDVALESCATEWQVCTQTGFSSVMLTCGEFVSSQTAVPWTCTAPPKGYAMVPGVKGVLYVSGDDATNEYLDDVMRSSVPKSLIDCSAAAPLPGPNVKTAVCFR